MARAIEKAREERKISQFDLALRVECRAQQVSVWERALARPSAEHARALAAELGLALDVLLFADGKAA